ncbi:MAG: tetratricopeptide repeat protein [candidate division Zixibacteria bacterium]|nr:tetratricopeptide repeat protein [candidate division Zixibacteria bacterium]
MSKNTMNKSKQSHAVNHVDYLRRAQESFARDNFKRAASFCKKATEFESGIARHQLAQIYFLWVLSLMKLEDYKAIDKLIPRAENALGKYLDLAFMKVMAAYGEQNYERVIALVDEYQALYRSIGESEDKSLCQSRDYIDEVLWLGAESAGKLLNIDKAAALMKESLSFRPDNHPHRVQLATMLAKDGRDEEALAIIDEGINLYPDVIALQNAKGFIYGEIERYEEAEKYLNDLLNRYPNDTDALNNLGVIYDKQGYYDRAKRYFRLALEKEPGNQTARNNLEYLENTIDETPQKISVCMIVKNEEKFLPGCLASIKGLADEIIVVDTGSTDRTMEIAREYGAKIYEHPWQNDFSLHRNQSIGYATGDWILIIDADEELDPKEHEVIRSAVKRKDIDSISFVVYNKIQSGRIGFLNSHRLFRNHKGFKYSGIVHNQLEVTGKTLVSHLKIFHHGYGLSDEQMKKKAERTEKLLLQQLKENPDAIFPHFNLAQIYRGMGEPAKSLEHALITIEKLGPNDLDRRHVYVMSLDQAGCAYIGLGRFDDAETIFKRALEYKSDYLDPMFNLGYMYMRQQRYDDAEAIFLRYLKTRESYSPHREWLGLILNNLNSQFAVYYGLGLIYFLRSQIDTALAVLQKALEYTEDFEYLHHLLARCYRQKGQFAKILEHCSKAIQYGHEDGEIRLLEGEAYLNLGDAGSAQHSFERALEIQPNFEEAKLGLVGVASLKNNPAETLKTIDEFLKSSPFSPQGLATRGDLLFELGDTYGAKKSYLESAKHAPYDYKVINNLGNCYLKEKNFASAEYCYLSALQKNRNFLPGYRNLAIALINQNRMTDALDYLEFYLSKNPNDADIHATIADIYYHSKKYGEALKYYEKYLMFYPQNLDVIVRIADCYFNMNKFQSAMMGYKVVLEKNPDHKIARQRLDELKGFMQPHA